jgi:hypothetical protein
MSNVNVEALVGKVLVVAGLKSYSSMPKSVLNDTAILEQLTIVQRVGGLGRWPYYLRKPHVQVDCYGVNKSSALATAEAARLAIHAMEGKTFTAAGGYVSDAFVAAVRDTLEISWQPDTDTGRDRYLFSCQITVRPL